MVAYITASLECCQKNPEDLGEPWRSLLEPDSQDKTQRVAMKNPDSLNENEGSIENLDSLEVWAPWLFVKRDSMGTLLYSHS